MSEQQQEQNLDSDQREQGTLEEQGSSNTQSSERSETTVFMTTTKHHTIGIAQSISAPILTPSVTATADSHAQTKPCSPGTSCALDGPSKATIVFWALIMGYVCGVNTFVLVSHANLFAVRITSESVACFVLCQQ
jgi:hypothetical protein